MDNHSSQPFAGVPDISIAIGIDLISTILIGISLPHTYISLFGPLFSSIFGWPLVLIFMIFPACTIVSYIVLFVFFMIVLRLIVLSEKCKNRKLENK